MPFRPEFAETIVSWLLEPADLFLVAPRTVPPLTVRKLHRWAKPEDRPFTLLDGRNPVGYAELNRLDHSTTHLWIGHFVIDPLRRRQRLGTVLLSALLRVAFHSPDVEEVSLTVFPNNLPAVHFYERAGFAHVQTQVRRFASTGRRHRLSWMRLTRESFETRPRP